MVFLPATMRRLIFLKGCIGFAAIECVAARFLSQFQGFWPPTTRRPTVMVLFMRVGPRDDLERLSLKRDVGVEQLGHSYLVANACRRPLKIEWVNRDEHMFLCLTLRN